MDPLYGKTYLPRKFKMAFAIPPLNDVDIFTNDLGFIVIAEGDRLAGYNLLAGGGMGMSHGNTQTFPAAGGRDLGFVDTASTWRRWPRRRSCVHRDFGDRTNRKHARLKYVLEERGVDWFRGEIGAASGIRS